MSNLTDACSHEERGFQLQPSGIIGEEARFVKYKLFHIHVYSENNVGETLHKRAFPVELDMPLDENVLYRIVGERIRTVRQQHAPPLSQAELAEQLGMSRASVVNIEAGRQRPPLHVLWQIASVLKIEPALLLPNQAEYDQEAGPVELDGQLAAQIKAAANGDVMSYRLLSEFVERARARK
jgi:transcriptional regulator with XRE-family HTH domain